MTSFLISICMCFMFCSAFVLADFENKYLNNPEESPAFKLLSSKSYMISYGLKRFSVDQRIETNFWHATEAVDGDQTTSVMTDQTSSTVSMVTFQNKTHQFSVETDKPIATCHIQDRPVWSLSTLSDLFKYITKIEFYNLREYIFRAEEEIYCYYWQHPYLPVAGYINLESAYRPICDLFAFNKGIVWQVQDAIISIEKPDSKVFELLEECNQ